MGGGHSHLQVLESLANRPLADASVTLVVDDHRAVYSGMVPGLVARQYQIPDLTVDLRPLAATAGVRVVEKPAIRIDPNQRRLVLADDTALDYTVASINIGARVAGLDVPGVLEHALPTRPIGEFVYRIEQLDDSSRRQILVVGGGAAGIELAFCLQSRWRGERTEVTLVDGARALLPKRRRLARRVLAAAKARGLEMKSSTVVQEVKPGRVTLVGGGSIPYGLLVWAAGAASHPLFTESGIETIRGFATTRRTLQLLHHDHVFAAGDCATLADYPETPKAGVYAVRQGPILSHNLRAALRGEPLRSYRPQDDFLTLLNLGDGTALGWWKGLVAGGRLAMRLKDRIDRRFVERFRQL
ncbi:MAG: FAD-dependent oxidoreductase [Thermoanaerobaculia bacterium]|nr:FAD-dependent oxidoreductase [Thermoanaerobaculia bacterium]